MKTLGKLPVCGADYTVKIGDYSDFQPLETAHGICDPSNRTIWVHSGMSPEKTLATLAHEALHALIAESGVMQMTEAALGRDDLDKWEEAVVRILTPHIMATFGPPQVAKGRR